MRPYLIAALACMAWPAGAIADDVTDTLDSARAAYEEGDIQYALEELAFATQLLQQMKAGSLADLLPAALDGFQRTIDDQAGSGMAMMGGTGAAAEYTNGRDTFTIEIIADSPMVATFAGIFGNAAMMRTMGEIVRVGREKFIIQDGDMTGVVDNRILIQASGEGREAIVAHLETMDFAALEDFGG